MTKEDKEFAFAWTQIRKGLQHLSKAINCFNGAARVIEPYRAMHHEGFFLALVNTTAALNEVFVDLRNFMQRKGMLGPFGK